MLLFQLLKILCPFSYVVLPGWLCHLLRLVIEDYKIAVLEVETIQLVTRCFRVHDVLVYNEGGALCLVVGPKSNLPDHSVSARLMTSSTAGNVPDGPKFAKEVEQILSTDIVIEVLDKQCSRRLVSDCTLSKPRGLYLLTSGASLVGRLIVAVVCMRTFTALTKLVLQ